MPTYGKLEEFDENKEKWTQYTERLGHYFTANGVTDAGKQRAILLSVCGSKVYKLMIALLSHAEERISCFQANNLKELFKDVPVGKILSFLRQVNLFYKI